MNRPEAYWSEEDRCWFVPVSGEAFASEDAPRVVEPVRVELTDDPKELWITKLSDD